MLVLGIETSCDETSAALVTDQREILCNAVLSQTIQHAPYGGIVPEIAARSHIEHLDNLIIQTMQKVGIKFTDLDAIAATAGPGLIGAVMVGLMTGKAISAVHDLPLCAVNHLEGHALSARLSDKKVEFPYLLLLISGGHCQLLVVKGVNSYHRLGTTLDDAAGEAFDKAAKLLKLPYPGGPAIQKAALDGNAIKFALPRPLMGRPGCDFSFSGLKTALLHQVKNQENKINHEMCADLAASFQKAVIDVVIDRCKNAIEMFKQHYPDGKFFVAGGGVVANTILRDQLSNLACENSLALALPPLSLCTDNAAMIAWAGIERLKMGIRDDLNAVARARWPLDNDTPPPLGVPQAGKLGRKS
jgi:N6-L-threonylcarbamoyladenine synthase